jgi:hypothetical protein
MTDITAVIADLEAKREKLDTSTTADDSVAYIQAALNASPILIEAYRAKVDECARLMAKMEGLSKIKTLDEELERILGELNFSVYGTAEKMRLIGHDIERKAEKERAAVTHLMLMMYLNHGSSWSEKAQEYLNQLHPEAGEGEKG